MFALRLIPNQLDLLLIVNLNFFYLKNLDIRTYCCISFSQCSLEVV